MWNENAPLELLKEMPKVLTVDNLCKIQEVIDKDKYLNSLQLEGDLCGRYAPFCDECNKSIKYPCAVAYVKMMQNQGMEVEMEEIPLVEHVEEVELVQAVAEEVAESPAEEVKDLDSAPKTKGKRIRIAIARKKN